MVIATGADSKYFRGLMNFVGSVHYWMPGTKVAVFNLGLETKELDAVSAWRGCELRWAGNGPPVNLLVGGKWKYCPHVRELKKYAWKPAALVEAVDAYGTVLWLDAGSDLRGSIDMVAEILAREGCFLVKGQDLDMTAKLHTKCPRQLGLRAIDFAGKPSFAGNTQGYVRGSAAAQKVLQPMYEAACEKDCIAPFGSSLRNHRYDQSILSLIAYSCGLELKDHTYLLSAHRSELESDPTKPSTRRIYTARCTSLDYIRYLERA